MANSINIDAGGTFTDGTFIWGDEREWVKVPTTRHDLTEGFFDCVVKGADELGLEVETLLSNTDVFTLSTTFGTNAIIEQTGPKLGVLTTAGANESLYGEGVPDEFFVDEAMIRGVEERVDGDGNVVAPVDEAAVLEEVADLIDLGARIIVVAFENATYNSANEEAVREAVRDQYPQKYLRSVPVQISTEVTAIPDDRRRAMSAIVNGYLHDAMVRNLYKAEDKVRDSGYSNPLLTVHSDGGAARIAKTKAINTWSSGTAASLVASSELADLYDLDSLLITDLGGTSADVGVVKGGTYDVNPNPEVEGIEVCVPMIEMTSIGAGGGSIASVEDGRLTVGPESAGARPGPACYGFSGERPTVTDADLVLGYINPDNFLGGEQQLDTAGAREAIDSHVADPLGIDTEEAAWRIKKQVDENIATSLEAIADQRGLEVGAIESLFSCGGAGQLHVCGYAEEMGFENRVLTFPFGGVFNTYGQSTLNVTHRYMDTLGVSVDEAGQIDAEYEEVLVDLREKATLDMEGEGFDHDDIRFSTSIVANHDDGSREIIDVEDGPLSSQISTIADAYAESHGVPAVSDIVLEAIQLQAIVDLENPPLPEMDLSDSDPERALSETRTVYWDGSPESTPVYEYAALEAGNEIRGPAVIEAPDTTYAVNDGWTYSIDEYRNGVLTRR